MKDDGIGVYLVERLKQENSFQKMEFIIGETDYLFCLLEIDPDDTVIIIDSTYFNLSPGTVTVHNLKKQQSFAKPLMSGHELNLIEILHLEFETISAFLIGVEVEEVSIGCELSDTLKKAFEDIYERVVRILKEGDWNA